jgi:hypothetical protein
VRRLFIRRRLYGIVVQEPLESAALTSNSPHAWGPRRSARAQPQIVLIVDAADRSGWNKRRERHVILFSDPATKVGGCQDIAHAAPVSTPER